MSPLPLDYASPRPRERQYQGFFVTGQFLRRLALNLAGGAACFAAVLGAGSFIRFLVGLLAAAVALVLFLVNVPGLFWVIQRSSGPWYAKLAGAGALCSGSALSVFAAWYGFTYSTWCC